MPTIHKPFLLKLLLALLLFSGSLVGAHTLQYRRIPEGLKRQADRAAESGKTDTAIHYLRQYLEFQPEDIEALIQLADLQKTRNPSPRGRSELLFLYDKILRLDPDREATRREALDQALKLGRHSDAETHAEVLLKDHGNEAELWRQLGLACTRMNKLNEARKAYETGVARAPDEMIGYQELAQVLWQNMHDPIAARAVLDRMVLAMPQEPMAYYYRAYFDSVQAEESARTAQASDLTQAIHDLNRALELDPENATASLLLGELLQKNRNIPAAHAIFRDGASLYPRDVRFIRSLAWLELVRGNTAAAMSVLEDGLKHIPADEPGRQPSQDGFDLLVALADLLVQEGDTTRSTEILKRLDARHASPLQVKYLKARIAMRQETWSEAIALLDGIRTEAVALPGLDAQVNQLLATCHDRTGNPDAAEKAFRRALGTDPANAAARAGLAQLYLNLGRFDDATREFEVATQSPYAPGSVIAQWARLKARTLRRTGGTADEWRRLEQEVAKAVTIFGPVSSEPLILQGDVAAAQNKHAVAARLLRQEVVKRPSDTRLWAALAKMTADAAGTAAGLAVIDEAQAAAGDGPDVRLARALLCAREPGRARPIDALGDRIDTWADADQLRLLGGLADVYDQIGERKRVVALLRTIAARRPTDTGTWLRLHERAVDVGDTAIAAEARAGVVRIEGETGPSVLVCDAVAGNNPQLADRLVATFGPAPNRADACLALARFRLDAGNTPEALRLTERAFALEPSRFETTRAFVALLARTGETERVTKVIDRLASDPRWAGEPFQRLMMGALDRVPPAAGATIIGLSRPVVERDPGGLGWVATAYTQIGQSADATDALIAATRSTVATADDWLRLALQQAATGTTEAATTLATARTKLPSPPFFGIAATFQLFPAGKDWAPVVTDPSDRRLFIQSRLTLALSRSDSAGARAVLEDYLAGPGLRPEDTGWARRNLAMLYASAGTPADRLRATELLQQTDDSGANPEELRATASVLATLARYLDGADRKATLTRAATALEMVQKTNPSPRDVYTLSQLHRMAGNRSESSKYLQSLLAEDPKNLYYLVTALDMLTDERSFATAEAFADRLRVYYSGEFRAVASIARYMAKAGKAESALTLAEQYASAADAGAGDYLARSARVAELLDEIVRFPTIRGTPVGAKIADAAVARYIVLVATRPEAAVGVAGVLGSEGRVAEALAKIEQFTRYRYLPIRVQATAGLAAIRSGGATEAQYGTVRGWLTSALNAEAGSFQLRMAEAEFATIRQRYDEAEAIYNDLLTKNPRSVAALNNLAWVLCASPATAERALELIDRATREDGLTGELLDTRARARITLGRYAEAEQDLNEAITIEATGLRFFHLAVLKAAQGQKQKAAEKFREARARGLDPRSIHPADLPLYRILEAENTMSLK